MSDPYTILGLATDSTDDAIRRRYLALVRTYTPERAPERFVEIREAYEKLRDPISRLRYQLFELSKDDSLDAIITDAKASIPRRRMSVATLLSMGRKRHG
ncbi:MAG: J domain-containing protein [Candidatus Tectomicrobia bacterium]